MDVCPGHILESTKGIEKKLVLQIDGSERKGRAQESQSYPVYLQCYLPLTIFPHNGYVSGHILESTIDWN